MINVICEALKNKESPNVIVKWNKNNKLYEEIIVTNTKPQYVYENNFNELWEQLKILFSSYHAGNTCYTNENNIIRSKIVETGLLTKIKDKFLRY